MVFWEIQVFYKSVENADLNDTIRRRGRMATKEQKYEKNR